MLISLWLGRVSGGQFLKDFTQHSLNLILQINYKNLKQFKSDTWENHKLKQWGSLSFGVAGFVIGGGFFFFF